ncbi:MAG: hypothetical protein RR902_06545, partial [Oscillospiraceae bacterium]
MDTAIYFASDSLQLVRGTYGKGGALISGCDTVKLDEGILINGVITDVDAMEQILWKLKNEGKIVGNVRVVIDSSSILTKRCVVPILSPARLEIFTKEEFANVDSNYQNLIHDYTVLERKKPGEDSGSILCCAMERAMVEKYIQLFAHIGVKIKTVDIALNCFLKVLREIPALYNRTYIYSVIEGNMIVSALFVDDIYMFSSRSKVMSERGTEGFINDILSRLSTLIQFNKSQKLGKDVEVAYFAGLNAKEMTFCNNLAG